MYVLQCSITEIFHGCLEYMSSTAVNTVHYYLPCTVTVNSCLTSPAILEATQTKIPASLRVNIPNWGSPFSTGSKVPSDLSHVMVGTGSPTAVQLELVLRGVLSRDRMSSGVVVNWVGTVCVCVCVCAACMRACMCVGNGDEGDAESEVSLYVPELQQYYFMQHKLF